MSEPVIDGRPKLPAPDERLALPAPEGHAEGGADHSDARPLWYRRKAFWIATALLGLVLLAALFFGGGGKGEEEQGGGRPPATVGVARAQASEWREEVRAIGTLEAIQGVDVTTELGGTVAAIRFSNGGRARAGETLVQLDTTTERAQLAALLAQAEQARLAYERALRLIERGAIAEAEVEQARANYRNLSAQADQIRTVIEKKRIDAPFSGELGIRQVDVGQYLAPGTAVVPLQKIAPIYVNFDVPENEFARLRVGQRVELQSDAFGERTFGGRINAINPRISQPTRSVTVQATIDNRERLLRPGMFADVMVLLPGSRRVVTVPASAVTTNAYGETVYRVARPDPKRQQQEAQRQQQAEEEQGGFLSGLFGGGSGGAEKGGSGESGQTKGGQEKGGEGGGQPQSRYVARTQFVRTGERRGTEIEILRGLKAGDPIVTAGQLKLEDHAPIVPQARQAGTRVNPRPQTP